MEDLNQIYCESHVDKEMPKTFKITIYLSSQNKSCFKLVVAAAAKLLQSCPTLCDAIDGSLPGFPVPGILQARTLEWFAIPFSNV